MSETQFDPKTIEAMLLDKKPEEARVYMQSFLKKDMTEAEKAEIHSDFAILYVKVMNLLKEQRNAALREILSNLELIDNAEKEAIKETKDKISLAEVRSKLNKGNVNR